MGQCAHLTAGPGGVGGLRTKIHPGANTWLARHCDRCYSSAPHLSVVPATMRGSGCARFACANTNAIADDSPPVRRFLAPMSESRCAPVTLRIGGLVKARHSARRIARLVVLSLIALACREWSTDPLRAHAPMVGSGRLRPAFSSGAAGTVTPMISSGFFQTCALRIDGSVVCWDNTGSVQPSVPAGTGPVAQISVGASHICAVTVASTVVCWGSNGSGESTPPPGLGSVTQVSAGNSFTCALTSAGTVACWGAPFVTAPPTGLSGVVQVTAGVYGACALTGAGAVTCWDKEGDVPPSTLAPVSQLSTGVDSGYVCGIQSAGALTCWPGSPPSSVVTLPTSFSFGSVSQVASGPTQACAVETNGAVDCWTTFGNPASPVPSGLGPATQVSTGYQFACALLQSGGVSCWGYDTAVPAGLNLLQTQASASTPVGSNVTAQLVDRVTNTTPATLTFSSVTTAGQTSLTTSSAGASPPPNFKLGNPPVYYDITTTATYSGPITVCFTYSPSSFTNASNVRLFHETSAGWVDVTTSVDPTTNTVCGQTTSLSPFILAEFGYGFSGFFSPVSNAPTANLVNAGAAVPVKFSLGSDAGLDIFAANSPSSAPLACGSGTVEVVAETATASTSGLTYDAVSGTYTYVWKTDKAWQGTCRQFTLGLNDGQTRTALFQFK